MLKRLYCWFMGLVLVEIKGLYPERFFNLCGRRKIALKQMNICNGNYYALLSLREYKKVRPLARKSHCIPYIKKKIGFPFFWLRYKKRAVFFLSCIGGYMLISFLSLHIWDISVSGGFVHTEEQLLRHLKELNIVCGMKKDALDCASLEKELRITYNDIGWVSAEIKGTRLYVRITETNQPPVREQGEEACHMVAVSDGIVQSITTRVGTPLVKEGDVVKKGDLLISGIVTVTGDNETLVARHPVRAEGDIVLKTVYEYENSFPLTVTEHKQTGRTKTGLIFYIGNRKIFSYTPRYSYDKYDIMTEDVYAKLNRHFCLPLHWDVLTFAECEEVSKTYEKREAEALAQAYLNRYLEYLKEQKVEVLQTELETKLTGQSCTTKGRLLVASAAWEYLPVTENEWRLEQTDEYSGINDGYTNGAH